MSDRLSALKDFWKYGADVTAARIRLKIIQEHQDRYKELKEEYNNIRFTHDWSTTQDSEEAALSLIMYVNGCASYMLEMGQSRDLLEWCQQGLDACARLQHSAHQLYFLRGKAQNALGLWNEAEESFQQAIRLSEKLDPKIHAQATLTYGRLLFNQGNYNLALKILNEAEQLLIKQNDSIHLADVRSEIAAYYMNKLDLDKALALYLEVEKLLNQAHGTSSHEYNIFMLGVVYRKKRNYPQSLFYLERFLAIGEEQGNLNTIATALHHIAWVYLSLKDISAAYDRCYRAIDKYKDTGDERGLSDAYEQLGRIHLAKGNSKDALIQLSESLKKRKELKNQQGIATSHGQLFKAYARSANIFCALWHLCAAVIIYQKIGMLSRQRIVHLIQRLLPWWK